MRKEELEELAELTLRKCVDRGAGEAAVLATVAKAKLLNFANNQAVSFQSWHEASLDMMLSLECRRLVVRVNNTSPKAIDRAVEEAVRELRRQGPGVHAALPRNPRRVVRDQVVINEDELSGRLIDLAYDAVDAALSEGAVRVAGSLTAEVRDYALATSPGFLGFDSRSSFNINVRAFSKEGASGQSAEASASLSALSAERAGREAGSLSRVAGPPVNIPEGRYDAVLDHLLVANLMSEAAQLASAYYVSSGLSPLANKLSDKVGADSLTLIDDGTRDDGPGSRSFDDEGSPSKKTIIIQRGVLESYLHNATTAKQFNAETTGNAGWIVPTPWNVEVLGGDYSLDELLSECQRGLYLTNGWYMRFHNYRTGDFSIICRDAAFLVEDGEVKASAKGVRISDNMLRVLKAVKALSKQRKWVEWWEVETPSYVPRMLISNLQITKAQG